jgi:ATP-binding protein involved in chromosome partitioning
MPMPLEIVGLGQPTVRFVWDHGDEDLWTARALRLRCTCAYCQSETTGERLLDPASIAVDLTIANMSLVGNYGVSIAFSDGHSTGIYRFKELYANRPIPGAAS